MLGAIVAIVLEIDEAIQAVILTFIWGMLLYILSRDIIPKEEKGHPSMFVVGVAVIIGIWLVLLYIS